MKLYLNCTANLGDFLNSLPVLSGLSKELGKFDLIVKGDTKKFKGFKEFLMYQDLFTSVEFDDEIFLYGDMIQLSSWTREDKDDPNRPIETCRYENWILDNYRILFKVDDEFEIKVPELNIEIEDVYYCGDRWNIPGIDSRRKSEVLSHLEGMKFLDYNEPLLTNAYIIKNLKKPFITNFTGVAVLADLLNVPSYVVWKAEDWDPEFRVGDNCYWDNGKDINKVFEKHFYLNRKSKLVHASELPNLL
jgi:hypothetical protein